MKASVQYNDLKGTAAADVSDFYSNSLQNYLISTYKTFDGDRYHCVGCTLFAGNQSSHVNISFVCYDSQELKHVSFYPLEDYTVERAISLFKRFHVVIGERIDDIEISDDCRFDLE